MNISIFTTIKDPKKRGDTYKQAFECYKDLADEVIIVDGSKGYMPYTEMNTVNSYWPKEFSWEFIGQQFQKGYEAATGDWVIHMDLDMLFHENDFDRIRTAFLVHTQEPAVAFVKRQFILPDRYNVKSRLIVAINKRVYGNDITFSGGGDLCQPSYMGKYIKPQYVAQVNIPIYNYECLLKTKDQLLEDKGRFARAWQRQFGEYKLGGPDDESAYKAWLKMVVGRFTKPQEFVAWGNHPKYIKETIRHLKPKQWGYSGFGLIEGKVYG